jgi:uncharacterized protein (TIGR00661 family)
LVYLPAYHDEVLHQFLWNFSAKWTVFSKYCTAEYTKDNVTFCPIENDSFLKTLSSCSGVLCGAGFELPAEAMFLNKKLMVIPMENQFEQQCNAESLKKLGVKVLPKLDLMNYRDVYDWLKYARPIQIVYADETQQLIEKIVKDHATSETIELENNLTPQVNWQFYRYFF